MPLEEYRRKRNFKVTGEPRGGRVTKHKELKFVIQKHAASHLHYDFRLELDGVLLSWAVPKGPSLDPAQKRLAMHVEDHPLEYASFEGIIPQGEYGGGTVMLWDQGTWEPVGEGKQDYRAGALKFILHGQKLQGQWMLVRQGGKRDPHAKNWFLFKERDEWADPYADITTSAPLSVTTGRDLDEIAAETTRVWGCGGETKRKVAKVPKTKKPKASRLSPAKNKQVLATLKKIGKPSTLPANAEVQLATLVKEAPQGDEWIHEIKFDGYRMLCTIEAEKIRFISRNDKDWTAKFPTLVKTAQGLGMSSAVLDGEVVILQPDGTTSFQLMQNAFQDGKQAPFLFYVFDLLHLNGYDIRSAPIEDRKALLRQILPTAKTSLFKFSEHVTGNGPKFFAEAEKLKLEGIISKRLGQRYEPGRGPDWLKIKCSQREEFVIGGFTAPGGGRHHFGALLLGYYDSDHKLVYAGRVGTGFDQKNLALIHAKLTKLVQKESPFSNLSGHTGAARGVTWVKPELVGQVVFSQWTDERQLRHPAFLGLREDKPAKAVVRDDPLALSAVKPGKAAKATTATKRRAGKSSTAAARKYSDPSTNEVAGVVLSHPDKVLYPESGITKLDLAHYYEQIAEWMLPHVQNRLLSLVRCPMGSGTKCFFQKHPAEGTPEVFRRFAVTEKSKTEEHLTVDSVKGLISLVQMGVLEVHIWGSQADQYEKPDRLIIDLDPDPTVTWPQVVTAAKEVRLVLQELGLVSFLKTTGGKGLHLVVPIRRTTTWPDAKRFCRAVADFLVAAAPQRYIANMSKAQRVGKIFVDYLRNDQGSTAIAPFSTRAKPGATVSVPIAWDELDSRLKSDHFTIRNLPARLAKLRKDPWADIHKTAQSITAAMFKKLALP